MARTDGKPENQHYVPKMLLRNFAPTDRPEQIHVFDKQDQRVFLTNIKNIAAERNFYEVNFQEQKASLEPNLSELETKSTLAFSRLIEHRCLGALSKADLEWIAVFAAAQILRSKNMRQAMLHMDQQIADRIKKLGFSDFQVDGWTPIISDQDLTNQSIFLLMSSVRDFAAIILSKVWLLVETNRTSGLFWIGDNPVPE